MSGTTARTDPARPLVSVIVPVHDGARFLPDAISSIREQRYEPLEIIVVDDGSTDDSWSLASSLSSPEGPVRAVRQLNRGPAAARNRGLSLARGDLIAFLDVDDLWPPDKLDTQVRVLVSHPGVDVVQGRTRSVVLPDAELGDASVPAETPRSVHLGNGVFRRRAFEKIGSFDERLRYSEDHDWFLRAREQGLSILVLDRVTLLYRIHAGNMTRSRDAGDFQLPEVLKRSLDRRRAR